MKHAAEAALVGANIEPATGRLRIRYRVDGFEHVVHAIYHDAPRLPIEVWDACIQELALACLVDISTATMAAKTTSCFPVSRRARRVFVTAAEALRFEALAERGADVRYSRVMLGGFGSDRPLQTPRTDPRRVLLLMGGGKDSLYSYSLLRRAGYRVQCFYLTEARRSWQQLRKVYRALSAEVSQHRAFLDVNRRSVLDQHYGGLYLSQFQIGEVVAASLPYAFAHACRYIALGLERSSDLPMYYFRRKPVNHQHQKSSGFIASLNDYLSWKFRGAVRVVSPVHGLYDMGIYARFLRTDRNLVRLQSSCGGANSSRPHCGRCAKCAFLAALLAGLSGDRALYSELFPVDPLNDPALYQNWLEEGVPRPLTCAGLKEEVRLALHLARSRAWPSGVVQRWAVEPPPDPDRKSTRLNSSH